MVVLGGFSSWVPPFLEIRGKASPGVEQTEYMGSQELASCQLLLHLHPNSTPSPHKVSWGNGNASSLQTQWKWISKTSINQFCQRTSLHADQGTGDRVSLMVPWRGSQSTVWGVETVERQTCFFSFCFPDLWSLYCAVLLLVLTFKEEVFGVGWGSRATSCRQYSPLSGQTLSGFLSRSSGVTGEDEKQGLDKTIPSSPNSLSEAWLRK